MDAETEKLIEFIEKVRKCYLIAMHASNTEDFNTVKMHLETLEKMAKVGDEGSVLRVKFYTYHETLTLVLKNRLDEIIAIKELEESSKKSVE